MLALRKAAGLSQIELANLVGETQQNIAFWEQSDTPPRSEVLPKMARALGVEIPDILGSGPVPEKTSLLAKINTLPPDKIVEVEDFVDFLRYKNANRVLVRQSLLMAEPTVRKIWDNEDDAEYDLVR